MKKLVFLLLLMPCLLTAQTDSVKVNTIEYLKDGFLYVFTPTITYRISPLQDKVDLYSSSGTFLMGNSLVNLRISGTTTNAEKVAIIRSGALFLPTTGNNSTFSSIDAKMSLPTIGANTPTCTDYTTSGNNINVSNAVAVIIENVGTTNSTFTYAGSTYNVGFLTNIQGYPNLRKFQIECDPLSKKYAPIPAIVANGSVTGTIRVTVIPKQ